MKKIIYVDMDNVIADFDKAAEQGGWVGPKDRPDKFVNFRTLNVIPGSQDALKQLNNDFNIFIASTPSWSRPETWADKREWIEEHFPFLKKKLILTHRKDLLIGDLLIDDSYYRGQPFFHGIWLWFGKNEACKDWSSTLKWIYEWNKGNVMYESDWMQEQFENNKKL